MIRFRLLIIGLLCFIASKSWGMVEDNRFFPEYPRNYSRTCSCPSAAFFDGFVMTGNEAFDHNQGDQDIGLFDIFGSYFENKLVDAVVAVGFDNPFDLFPSLQRFRGQEILWNMDGKIQSQGVAFQWDQLILPYTWVGGSCFFMHLYSRNDFTLNASAISSLFISPDDQIRLDELRRLMNVMLQLEPSVESRTGFSDIDCYIRVGNIWEYLYKFKRVDAGIKFGSMVPSGLVRNIRNPASLPFGGDGHWGVYTSGDFELELKEDWKVGAHARVNKRFAKTKNERLPVVGEQQLFGAVQGPVRIKPGCTFIVSPYARLENIREGFGLQAGYTIAYHMQDQWIDERANPTPLVVLEENDKKSSWVSEYVSVDAFFDCSKLWSCCYAPILSFKWDVPLKIFAAKGAAKTNRVLLGVELNY